jgi:hypothetical protein
VGHERSASRIRSESEVTAVDSAGAYDLRLLLVFSPTLVDELNHRLA